MPAIHGLSVMMRRGRAVAALISGYISAAMTPRSAERKPTGSIMRPPMMKPFCAVRTSLAPREIWMMAWRERFTVMRTTIQVVIVIPPTPLMKSREWMEGM